MLNGFMREYNNVKENMKIIYPRNREVIKKHAWDRYLDLSVKGRMGKQNGQALVANGIDTSRNEGSKSGRTSSRNQENRKPSECFRCGLSHMPRYCQARVMKAPSKETVADFKSDSGKLVKLRAVAASVSRPFHEKWYGNTYASRH